MTEEQEISPAVATFLMARAHLVRDGKVEFAVRDGKSMSPFLHSEDLVSIYPIPEKGPKIGDVLVFKLGDSIAVHRLLRIRDNLFIAKGDNNSRHDRVGNLEQVIGVVRSLTRGDCTLTLDSPQSIFIGKMLTLLSYLDFILLRFCANKARSRRLRRAVRRTLRPLVHGMRVGITKLFVEKRLS